MTSRKQRIISVISALVFGAVIPGSLFFIASASAHDCTGDGCHICEMIKQCEKLLDAAGGAVRPCVSHFALIFAMTAVLLCGRAVFGRSTLISLKAELPD